MPDGPRRTRAEKFPRARRGEGPRIGAPAAARDMTGMGIPQLYVAPAPEAEDRVGEMGMGVLDKMLFGMKGHEIFEKVDESPPWVRGLVYGSPAEALIPNASMGAKMAFDPLLAVVSLGLLGGIGASAGFSRSIRSKINQMTRRSLDDMTEAGLSPIERAYLHVEDAGSGVARGRRPTEADNLRGALHGLEIETQDVNDLLNQVDELPFREAGILPRYDIPSTPTGSYLDLTTLFAAGPNDYPFEQSRRVFNEMAEKGGYMHKDVFDGQTGNLLPGLTDASVPSSRAHLDDLAANSLDYQRAVRADPFEQLMKYEIPPPPKRTVTPGGYLPVMEEAAEDLLTDLLPVGTTLKRGGLEEPYLRDFMNLVGLEGSYPSSLSDPNALRLNMKDNLERLGYLTGGLRSHTVRPKGQEPLHIWEAMGQISQRIPAAQGGNLDELAEKRLANLVRGFLKTMAVTR